MPPRGRPPADLLDAIREHAHVEHGISRLDLDEVGKPGSRSRAIRFVWHDGAEWTEAWFVCRRCPEGFDRYLLDVDRDQPSDRILPLIRNHLARHDVDLEGAEELSTRALPREGAKAYYYPPHARDGGGITCPTCKARGENPITLTTPPYGDARRLHHAWRIRPSLHLPLADFASSDRAVILDALDRGLLGQRLDPAEARRALTRNQHPRAQPAQSSDYSSALARVMDDRVAAGERISHVISHLAQLADTDPVAFSCQVGEHLPALQHQTALRPAEFARLTNLALGRNADTAPTISTATLWRIWTSRDQR
jgi:hypothetical protein